MGGRRKQPNKRGKKKTGKQPSVPVDGEAPKSPAPLPSVPEQNKQDDSNKKANTNPPKKYQSSRDRHVGFLLGVSYQVVAVILVALAFLALGYYMNNKDYKGIILSAFVLYVAIGLLITLYALQHYRSNKQPLAVEQNTVPTDPAPQQSGQAENLAEITNKNQNKSQRSTNLAQKPKDKPESNDGLLLLEKSAVPLVASDTPTDHWIEGIVKESDNGDGIKGVIVTIQNLRTADEYKIDTDNDGYFSRKLPFGDYRVTISYPGFRSESRQCKISKERGCYVVFSGLQKVSSN